MTFVILQSTNGPDVYVNPEHVESIQPIADGSCYVETDNNRFTIRGNANLVASIISTQPTRPDKFVSYKDWQWYNHE